MVGRNREWICGAERGTRGVKVTVSMFGILATALGVPVDEFVRADANIKGYGPAQRRVLLEQIGNAVELGPIFDTDFDNQITTCSMWVQKAVKLEQTSSYKELGELVLWLVPRLDDAFNRARGRTKDEIRQCLRELDDTLLRFIRSELQTVRAVGEKVQLRTKQRERTN